MITTTGWDGTGVAHPNSCRVNIAAGDTLAALIAAVDAFLTAHSWELYDAAAGVNARAYRCLALPDANGAIHYGIAVVDFNTSGYLYLKHYESWNPATHVGTSIAYLCDVISLSQRVPSNTGGVFDTPGWLKIQASQFGIFLVGNNGVATGTTNDSGPIFIVQRSRTGSHDLVGIGAPKWVWGSSGYIDRASFEVNLSMARNLSGSGSAAAVGVFTDYGAAGWINGQVFNQANRLMPGFLDNVTGKLVCSNVRVQGKNSLLSNTEFLGTLLDFVMLTNGQGVANIDDVTFFADDDADFGGAAFIHAGGSLHTWWVLGGTTVRIAVRK